MSLKTHKFVRKPFYVDAVRVNEANMEEAAVWCGGEIKTAEDGTTKFIKVTVYRPMNDRQTEAYIGDWLLNAGTGFKVYVPKAFDKSFEKVKTLTKAQADAAGIKVPHEKSQRPEPVNPVLSNEQAKLLKDVGEDEKQEREPDVDYRDAKTGQYVSEETAEANPDTTVAESDKPAKSAADVEADKLIKEVLRER